MGLFKGAWFVPLSIRSWKCSFGQTNCSALRMMAFRVVALLDFFLYFAIKFHLHWRGVLRDQRKEWSLLPWGEESFWWGKGGWEKQSEGKGKLLNGKNKARDGDLSCLACTSERVCPLACVTWACCPSSRGDSVTECGNFGIILAPLVPQGEPALTTDLSTCLFFFLS